LFCSGCAPYEEVTSANSCGLGCGEQSERSGQDWRRNGECPAACANIITGVQSIYHWKGKVVKAKEALLILKSTRLRYRALERAIKTMHTYETPEIIALPVKDGFEQYIGWVCDETHS
jgi:uncharacterized protein involved in tolerance to divalent cations